MTMDCRHVRDIVDAIAGDDGAVSDEQRAHFESCPACAAALAAARRLEALLASREAPDPPVRFTQSVLQRIRRERWSAEQRVDLLFNAAVVFGLVVIVAGIGALMNLSGVLSAAGTISNTLAAVSQDAARQAAPAVVTYVAAAGLLVSALATWWWAERKLSW
jgi:anti-sigma factor RsiW